MQFPKHTQCGFNLLGLYRSILSISLYYPILSRLFLVTFCIVFTANAQWQPVNGPYEATFFKISIDPQNPNVIYTAGESVYRSTNKGESWTNIEPNTLLSSNLEPVIKADPKNSGVVYFEGKGALFKSYDYGENWIINWLVKSYLLCKIFGGYSRYQ
ncbi:MAG: hypothetical protein H3C35_13695, partial [Bacteroidetes bacterium]|nr:hypothetical protein [Bacteroidota bacterium]